MYIYIYMYDPSAWTPNSEFMQSLFCNHSAIFTVQSSIQSLLCYVFFATFCWQYWKTIGFSGFFWTHIAKNTKPVFFATFCWKYGKTVGSPLFFCTRSAKASQNLCFLHYFAEHAGKRWFSFVSGAHIVKNRECIMIFYICSIQIPIQVPFTTAERPPSGLVS